MKNYYRILNVRTNATDSEIKLSYRTLAKRYHPDVNPQNKEAAQRFADITEAYNVLSDAEKRTKYDSQLWQATAQRAAAQQKPQQAANRQYQDQLQAQIQAQVQSQVAAQLEGVKSRAYKEGYDRGMTDGRTATAKAYSAEQEKSRKRAGEDERNRRELEQELFDRDRELAKANERVRDLDVQLQWYRKASYGKDPLSSDALRESLNKSKVRLKELELEMARVTKQDLRNNPSGVKETPMEIKQKADEMNKNFVTLNNLMSLLETGINELREDYERQKKLSADTSYLYTMEQRAKEWSEKVKQDTKLAKGTHYGTLGVLIWATDKEIDASYEKFRQHYLAINDFDSLTKLKDAYSVIADPQKRKEYNAMIGYSEARIHDERKLIENNEKVQEVYRSKIAARDFWARFDELVSYALAGDSDAQNLLGELYYSGETVERDLKQAVYWFREAFMQKNPAAMHNLGVCYANGEGTRQNKSIGLALFRQAANLGYNRE